MVIRLDDRWIWDSWYVRDDDRWHAFFLQADKSLGDPELRHFNVSQGHAVSTDLIDWDHQGTCFAPATGPAFDDFTTWTGSVVRDEDGKWHLFYTGGSRSEEGLYQRIGHAISEDLHDWKRVGTGECMDMNGPASDRYENRHVLGHWHDRAMRDPWVMRDPESEGWLMYFTARAPDIEEPNAGGAIGFATSPDLYDWTLQPPVFVGGFGQLEVPQVFEAGGRWYCLFCTAAQHFSRDQAEAMTPQTGNHYLIGDSPRGPWHVAPGPMFDGDIPCRRYAARICDTGDGLVIMGFRDGGREDFHGYVMDPEPVDIDRDGLLEVRPRRQAAE